MAGKKKESKSTGLFKLDCLAISGAGGIKFEKYTPDGKIRVLKEKDLVGGCSLKELVDGGFITELTSEEADKIGSVSTQSIGRGAPAEPED